MLGLLFFYFEITIGVFIVADKNKL